MRVSTTLRIPARVAWETLRRRDTFLFITRGAMRYQGCEDWPELLMKPGVEIETIVYPLGFLPGTPHTFRIVSVDAPQMAIETEDAAGSFAPGITR